MVWLGLCANGGELCEGRVGSGPGREGKGLGGHGLV